MASVERKAASTRGRRSLQVKMKRKDVKEAIFKLIDHNQPLEELVEELQTKVDHKPNIQDEVQVESGPATSSPATSSQSSLSTDSFLLWLNDQARSTSVPLPVVAARRCGEMISQTMRHNDQKVVPFWPEHTQALMEQHFVILRSLSHDHALDRSLFLEILRKQGPLPIQLIWQLHHDCIIPLDTFISHNLGSPAVFSKLVRDIVQLCFTEMEDDRKPTAMNITRDFMVFLVSYGYPEISKAEGEAEKALEQAYQVILKSIFIGILEKMESLQEKGEILLNLTLLSHQVPKVSLKLAMGNILPIVLGFSPTWNATDAIAHQNEWKFASSSPHLRHLYKEMLNCLEASDALRILQQTLEEEEVNWKNTLLFVSCILLHFSEGVKLLKELIDYFLKEAFDIFEQEGLIAGLLLVRQAANEGPENFTSYEQWFQDTFRQQTSLHSSNRKAASFLLSFLTNLVPYEPATYLKVHVRFPPFIQAKWRDALDDFTTLAKTRLNDLKVPWESSGIYQSNEPNTSNESTSEVINPAERDVRKAVEAFESSGRIPSNVMEASIFRRPYFRAHFLPMLLIPRMLPDIPDAKMNLIEAMKSAGKIPPVMYEQYLYKCQQMLSELLEGSFSAEVMDDFLEPVDSLKAGLEKLAEIGYDDQAEFRSQLAMISSKLKLCYIEELPQGEKDYRVLCLESIVTSRSVAQIIDVLVAGFEDLVSQVCPLTSKLQQRCFQPIKQFVVMVSGHPAIVPDLMKALWKSCLNINDATISDDVLFSLAVFLTQIEFNGNVFPRVSPKHAAKECTLMEVIGDSVSVTTMTSMKNCIRLLSFILQVFLMNADNSILLKEEVSKSSVTQSSELPPIMVQKFSYLAYRLVPCLRVASSLSCTCSVVGDLHSAVHKHFNSAELQELVKSQKGFSFKQWLEWEMKVEVHQDILSVEERADFFHWIVHCHFLPCPEEDGGCGNSYEKACAVLIHEILNHLLHPEATDGENKKMQGQCGLGQFISLLIELLPMMAADHFSNSKPLGVSSVWFLSVLEQRLDGLNGTSLPDTKHTATIHEVESFLRLAVRLPPYLLISNHIGEIPSHDQMRHLAKFLRDIVKPFTWTEPWGLSFSLTAQIIKGFVMSFNMLKDNQLVTQQLRSFLEMSQLFSFSLVVNWRKLKDYALVLASTSMKSSDPLRELDSIHDWSVEISDHSKSSLHHLPALSEPSVQYWLHAAALLANLLKSTQMPDGRLSEAVHFLQDLSPGHEKVAVLLTECLVAACGWAILHGDTKGDYLLQELHKISRTNLDTLIFALADKSFLKENVFHPSANGMFPVVFFKINQMLDEHPDVYTKSKYLPVLVENHCKLRLLYKKDFMPYRYKRSKEQEQSVELTDDLPLTLDFYLASTKVTEQAISRSSRDSMELISLEVFQQCAPELQNCLRSRAYRMSIHKFSGK